MDPKLIAVVGASGSGKTTVANQLHGAFNLMGRSVELISMDNYYKAVGHPLNNYDRPAAFDFDLLIDALCDIKSGKAIDVPTYDFVTHRRQSNVLRVEPADIILVEGLFLFADQLDDAAINFEGAKPGMLSFEGLFSELNA